MSKHTPKCACGAVVSLYFSERLGAYVCPACQEKHLVALLEACKQLVGLIEGDDKMIPGALIAGYASAQEAIALAEPEKEKQGGTDTPSDLQCERDAERKEPWRVWRLSRGYDDSVYVSDREVELAAEDMPGLSKSERAMVLGAERLEMP